MTRIRTTLATRNRISALVTTMALSALVSSCRSHPVADLRDHTPRGETAITMRPEARRLDVLWVIDNSNSMCEEQRELREHFEAFIEPLMRAGIDLHLGVTTTHVSEDDEEPVAKPGHLQSVPQPIPSTDPACHLAIDDGGTPIPGDYSPIREAITAAVACMREPDESLLAADNADIECALYGTPEGCAIERAGCGESRPCAAEDLFPEPSTYRKLPLVLRTIDYWNGDKLDLERLKADFACMSFVGTRGDEFEKGLEAVLLATSPQLTGGALAAMDADSAAPNHGLIRRAANFAAIFVTDENDCSHDGGLDEHSACGDDVCAFANRPGADDSPLLDPQAVALMLLENLRQTKGSSSYGLDHTFVASLHPNPNRYTGEVLTEAECGADGYEPVSPSCVTRLGHAYSGDRYERFLRAFPVGQYFPAPDPITRERPLTGWTCTSDLRPGLAAVGEFLTPTGGSCLTRELLSCSSDADCPPFAVDGEGGSCIPRPNSEGPQFFCDSSLLLLARAFTDEAFERLRDSELCSEESAADRECLVDRDAYTFGPCYGGVSGVTLQWSNPQRAAELLDHVELLVIYDIPR